MTIRTIELYIDPDQIKMPAANTWNGDAVRRNVEGLRRQADAIRQAFVQAGGPHDPPYGTRTILGLDPGFPETFRATWDHHGFRLVFEDELPKLMSIPREIVYKTVITDRVRESARANLKECAGTTGSADADVRSAWRVTASDSHYWEIVVQSSDPVQAGKLFEEIRAGGHAAGKWVISPWRAVNL